MGMPVGPWPNGCIWYFPEEEHEQIVLQAGVIVRHFRSRCLEVTFDGDLVDGHDGRARPAQSVLLAGGDGDHRVLLHKDFTVEELAENHGLSRVAGPSPIVYRGPSPCTTVARPESPISLDLTGCPLQPHESRDGAWVVVPHHVIDGSGLRTLIYGRRPTRRLSYWISRQDGL